MKTNTSRRTLIIRLAAALVLIAIGYCMTIIGRGHTVYLDNKKLEAAGATYDAPYKVVVYVDDEQVAKLYKGERGSAVCIGQSFTMTLEITQDKGGSETTETYTLAVPKDMDNVLINLPAYLAGADESVYLEEFIVTVESLPEEDETLSDDDFGLDGGMDEMDDLTA